MCKLNEKIILVCAFNAITKRSIDTEKFDDRILMQKIAYILNEKNTPCGDYTFCWNTRGPYSDMLDIDIKDAKDIDLTNLENLTFTNRCDAALKDIRQILNMSKKTLYSELHWMEAVCSLHFMKTYESPFAAEEELIKSLVERKNYLDKNEVNRLAFSVANKF